MKLAYWPGLGGGAASLLEIEPALHERGIEAVTLDPRYGTRLDWSLDVLAGELVATGADVYAGHSWGAAVAVVAATRKPPQALILLDGGYIAPRDFPRFGAAATPDLRIAEVRAEHESFRWPSVSAYLEWCRSNAARWNATLEQAALDGIVRDGEKVLPPFDAEQLERILRGFEEYDPTTSLPELDPHVRVLLVAATIEDEHAVARAELVERFEKLVPHAEIRRAVAGHDVVWDLGPDLADLTSEWLLEGARL
jgi:pimeloyl-ACP methyl ester carboxylesterase